MWCLYCRINVYTLLPYTHFFPVFLNWISSLQLPRFVKFTFCPYLFLHAQVKHVVVLNNKSLRIRGEVHCISSTCSIFLLKRFISFLYNSARRPGHLSYCYLMGVLDQYLDFEKKWLSIIMKKTLDKNLLWLCSFFFSRFFNFHSIVYLYFHYFFFQINLRKFGYQFSVLLVEKR